MKTPVKRTPVIRTPVQRPITVGSRIKLKVGDKQQLKCFLVGKTGRVSEMYQDGTCYVILDCGHMCDVPLASIEKSNFNKCVNCHTLTHRSELKIPSFWNGSGGLCSECWKALKIDKYERKVDEGSIRGKRKSSS